MGRALTIAVTSAISVTRSLCVSWDPPSSKNMAFNTRRMVPICRSQTPPKYEACGGLKCHLQPWSLTYFSNLRWSISLMALSSSDFPPTKLEPWSHLSNNAGPRSERACVQDSRVSICMALLLRQVNTSPQRFKLVVLPLVLWV